MIVSGGHGVRHAESNGKCRIRYQRDVSSNDSAVTVGGVNKHSCRFPELRRKEHE